jgi:ribosomal protein S18 acetylase RimI-like enzyme
MKYKIRYAKSRDLSEIYTLYLNHRNEPSYSHDYDFTDFRRYVKSLKVDLIVADINDKIVGYILCYDHDNWGYIDSICVDPKHRKRGVGRLLVSKLFKFKKRWVCIEACYDQKDLGMAKFLETNSFKSKPQMIYKWMIKFKEA